MRIRASSDIRNLRQRTPYVNWHDGSALPSPSPEPTPSPPQPAATPTWTEEKPHGSRHVLDTAPFSLWDDTAHDYIRATREHIAWMFDTYAAVCIDYHHPFLVVATLTPSLPQHRGAVTLTLGCAPVVFATPSAVDRGFRVALPRANSNRLVDRVAADPLRGTYQALPWTTVPSAADAAHILDVLEPLCDVHALSFVYPCLVVELVATDGRVYAPESLPNRVGGWSVEYHRGAGFWAASRRPAAASRREIAAAPDDSSPGGDVADSRALRIALSLGAPAHNRALAEPRAHAPPFVAAAPPARQLGVWEVAAHEWFVCGGTALRLHGVRLVRGGDGGGVAAWVYYAVGEGGRRGVGGAAVVHEATGGVAGFARGVSEGGWCVVPVLDGLGGE